MENDSVTRVYITSGEGDAWEQYPNKQNFEDRLLGLVAQAVLAPCDFRGVNYEVFTLKPGPGIKYDKKVSGVWGFTDKSNGTTFDVDKTQWSHDEKYSKLAEELEKRSGKKGLTIVVS